MEDKWSAMKDALTEMVQSVFRKESRRHPDLFRDCASTLKPYLKEGIVCTSGGSAPVRTLTSWSSLRQEVMLTASYYRDAKN